MTPREVVQELDRYIVGQAAAKRAVAIALRNRQRRQKVTSDLKDEIAPKNIIMIGPTGVGKTEIARRLAKLANAPFNKVEASKFTEVGYVGRDVDSMVRDLVELGVQLVRAEEKKRVEARAAEMAEDKLLDILVPPAPAGFEQGATNEATREKFRGMLKAGSLDDKPVEIDTEQSTTLPVMQVFSNAGMDDMGNQLQDMFSQLGALGGGKPKKKRSVKVKEARELLTQQEAARLIDMEKVSREAVKRTEESGIIFIDEIDKIARSEGGGRGPDISREGVQRDLLPLVEGSTVNTKYGMVRTDHILFIAAGAFHVSKVSDLIPELQGRFPIRVELEALTEKDFVRILTEPKNSLVRQYTALLDTEQVTLAFTTDGVAEICRVAAQANTRSENIGARRLHTVMEKLLEDISFDAPETPSITVTIDAPYVKSKLDRVLQDEDLSKYIL